jgi:hypothetical protein
MKPTRTRSTRAWKRPCSSPCRVAAGVPTHPPASSWKPGLAWPACLSRTRPSRPWAPTSTPPRPAPPPPTDRAATRPPPTWRRARTGGPTSMCGTPFFARPPWPRPGCCGVCRVGGRRPSSYWLSLALRLVLAVPLSRCTPSSAKWLRSGCWWARACVEEGRGVGAPAVDGRPGQPCLRLRLRLRLRLLSLRASGRTRPPSRPPLGRPRLRSLPRTRPGGWRQRWRRHPLPHLWHRHRPSAHGKER